MLTKTHFIDNTDGAKNLVISSVPQFDFSTNMTMVRLFDLNRDPDQPFASYNSTKQIWDHNQKVVSTFSVPLTPGNLKIELEILIESDGVEDFVLDKKYN